LTLKFGNDAREIAGFSRVAAADYRTSESKLIRLLWAVGQLLGPKGSVLVGAIFLGLIPVAIYHGLRFPSHHLTLSRQGPGARIRSREK
jgi:hypothetical protein